MIFADVDFSTCRNCSLFNTADVGNSLLKLANSYVITDNFITFLFSTRSISIKLFYGLDTIKIYLLPEDIKIYSPVESVCYPLPDAKLIGRTKSKIKNSGTLPNSRQENGQPPRNWMNRAQTVKTSEAPEKLGNMVPGNGKIQEKCGEKQRMN